MLPEIAAATAAEWRSFLRIIRADAIAHGIPEDLAEDVAQAAALRLIKRRAELPTPRSGRPACMAFATALTRAHGRKYGYRSFLPRAAGMRAQDPSETIQVANRRASRHVPDPSVIAERAEQPLSVADDASQGASDRWTRTLRAEQRSNGLADSTAILAAYGVGPQALAEPGWTPDVVHSLGHQPPRLTRGVPAQPGDGTEVRTTPVDMEAEYARAAANRAARAERVADDRPWWMS